MTRTLLHWDRVIINIRPTSGGLLYFVVAAVSARTWAPETLKVRDRGGSQGFLLVLDVRWVHGACGVVTVSVKGRVGSFERKGGVSTILWLREENYT